MGNIGSHASAQLVPPPVALRTDRDGTPLAPKNLYSAFDSREVLPWEGSRFKSVRKLSDATRNHGVVTLMQDQQDDRLVAVKSMPNAWVREGHENFLVEHPEETEMPWQDIGCTKFLSSVDFAYGCNLDGVYRGDTHTYVLSSFASRGDFFGLAQAGTPPGPERESALAPLVVQLLNGVKQLHEMRIVHRDMSLENVLLTHEESREGTCSSKLGSIRIVDYSMASTERTFQHCARGKASYQAPEKHSDEVCDAFLADTFAVGVILYAILLKDYPWLSTRPGGCQCFDYIQRHGFRSYCANRKVRGLDAKVVDCISEDLLQLLEGMFALDPALRLTLGEKQWGNERRSVWDEPWIKGVA